MLSLVNWFFISGVFMEMEAFARCRRRTVPALAAVSLLLWPLPSQAQWLIPPASTNQLNFNFTDDPYGSYAGAAPKMYTGANSPSVTITVGDAPGMSKAAIIDTTATGSSVYGYLDQYPADGLTPTVFGKNGIYSFDINQIANSLDAGALFDSESIVYGYISGEGWIWGLALNPTSTAGGDFYLVGPGYTTGSAIATFTTGTVNHVEINHDYIAGTFDLRINGSLVAAQVPFDVGPEIFYPRASLTTNYQIKEIFAFSFNAGTGDRVITAFDNITYTLEVPEPSAMLLTAIGVAALGMLRRVRRVDG